MTRNKARTLERLDRLHSQARGDLDLTPILKPNDEPTWLDRLRAVVRARVMLAKHVGSVEAFRLESTRNPEPIETSGQKKARVRGN